MRPGVAGSLLDTFVKLFLGALGQISQPANRLKDAHFSSSSSGVFSFKKFFQQTHQRDDFSSGALPVFSGERVKREIFYVQIAATFDAFSNCLGASFVAFYARQSARLRPTAVAVHDDGDVAGNSLDA
jgi:hypothetical protein